MTQLPDAHAPAPEDPPAQRRRAPRWVPIRSLSARHRPRILAHLLALNDADRYLRFGHVANDAQIGRYVDQLDFDRDEVFGIFNRRLNVVAMAHLAFMDGGARLPSTAEFGVSVAERARGRGLGARLFDHAVLHARNRGVDTLIVHALTENTAMLRMVRSAGAQVERDGADATAVLKLPPEDLASHLEALVDDQVAEIDYGLKLQVHRLDALWHRLADAIPGSGGPDPGVVPRNRGAEEPPAV